LTTHAIPQFFGLAENSMMDDDGWRFCRLGQQLERAIITANAPLACVKAFTGSPEPSARVGHQTEIELSAFLRLLGTRDAYRRVYQMRAEPLPVLKLLFQNPEAPRSVLHSLTNCAALLRATSLDIGSSAAMQRPLAAVEAFCERLQRIDWLAHFEHPPAPPVEDFAPPSSPATVELAQSAGKFGKNPMVFAAASESPAPDETPRSERGKALSALLNELKSGTMDLHNVIADVFLNHQAQLSAPLQPTLRGFNHGI
jgi:hypothetical protein